MNKEMRQNANDIISSSIQAVLPDAAVARALKSFRPGGRVFLVSVGKAGWQMAAAAQHVLKKIDGGIVITKYGHIREQLPDVSCFEAGHPVPDENSFAATARALNLVSDLTEEDTVLFLLSGG
ncbi:MAG: glycerate-2-kinase family protein, partial [Lachnospiraceae bacterium]|nr:glycerate-2-kinase family protein [Lachnospiraceae bacterium]